MQNKKLNRIFLLCAAGVLVVVGVFGLLRANKIISNTPVVIEQPMADIVNVIVTTPSPEPSITPTMPDTAVTLLVSRKPVLTLSSEAEAQRLLWEYLKDSAHAPEGEQFVSAKFAQELILTKPEPDAQLVPPDEAAALMRSMPGLVPVQVTTLRLERAEAEAEQLLSEDAALSKGMRIITQLGAGAITQITTQVNYIAGVATPLSPVTETLREPRTTIVRTGTYTKRDTSGEPDKQEGKKGKAADGLKLDWPIRGSVSSRFGFRNGSMHNGMDFEAKAGTAITAPGEGIVVYCGTRGAYGFVVDIDHGNGFLSRLTHLADVQVEYNQRVFLDEPIGVLADNSADGKKPHLHYELIIDGVPFNPEFYVS